MSVTHPFVSAKADGADTTLVRPGDWNASHTVGSGAIQSGAIASGQNYFVKNITFPAATTGDGIDAGAGDLLILDKIRLNADLLPSTTTGGDNDNIFNLGATTNRFANFYGFLGSSGAVIQGTVGSGAIRSGNIASGLNYLANNVTLPAASTGNGIDSNGTELLILDHLRLNGDLRPSNSTGGNSTGIYDIAASGNQFANIYSRNFYVGHPTSGYGIDTVATAILMKNDLRVFGTIRPSTLSGTDRDSVYNIGSETARYDSIYGENFFIQSGTSLKRKYFQLAGNTGAAGISGNGTRQVVASCVIRSGETFALWTMHGIRDYGNSGGATELRMYGRGAPITLIETTRSDIFASGNLATLSVNASETIPLNTFYASGQDCLSVLEGVSRTTTAQQHLAFAIVTVTV